MEPIGGDWERLPEVLLPIIFNNLRIPKETSWNIQIQQVNQTALLNCRLVNKLWKKEMDRVLENQSLDDFWRIWKPDEAQFGTKAHNFPVLQISHKYGDWLTNNTKLDFLKNNLFQSSPIPTNSLLLKPSNGPRTLLENSNFFSAVGHHLTTVSFETFAGFNALSLKTVAEFLGHTPNLKALDLDTVEVNGKEWSPNPPRLPPLPHLVHLGVWDVPCSKPYRFDVCKWALEPYRNQLVSLVTNCGIEKGDGDHPPVFQKVEKLKLICSNPSTAVNFSCQFPRLHSLSLLEVRLGKELGFHQVWNFLCKHNANLVHLYLEISRKSMQGCEPVISYSEWSSSVSAKVTTFLELKTLSIFYPKCGEEVVMLKEVLKMVPKLEHLKLLHFAAYRWTPTDQDRVTARKHLESQNYLQLCASLKLISVQMTSKERTTFLICGSPRSPSPQQPHQDDDFSACDECGIVLLPNSFVAHRKICCDAVRRSLGTDKQMDVGNKGEKCNVDASNSGYISFNRGNIQEKQYGCRQCPYETLELVRIQIHVQLHEDFYQAAVCGDCGWFLPPEQLAAHRTINHSAEQLSSAS